MAEALSETEAKRRIKAFNSTKTPAHPTGSMARAAEILGDIGPNRLSKWLRDHGIKTDRKPIKTIPDCVTALHRYIKDHKKIPSRDVFTRQTSIGVKWKTYWGTWAEFLQDSGVISDPAKILVLDIETAPNRAYFWGPVYKQNINPDWIDANGYVLCWTAKWLGSDEVIFRRLLNKKHKILLLAMHELLDEAHAVVHYNGKKFDIPTLNKEFLTHGITPPSPYKQIDLLKTMWDTFLFPSNKLDYIAQTLKIGEKLRHEGPELWLKCMADNDEAWNKMESYNRRDVELTEKLYMKLRPWIRSHPNVGSISGGDVCPTCGSFNFNRDKEHLAQVLRYARYQCADCGTWFRSNKTLTQKRGDRFVAAV
jgi:DNA polymerase elongation subunit (family B)